MNQVIKFLILILLALLSELTNSQSCLPSGIGFYYQFQIDDFESNYPNCTEIEGDVYIDGNDITNLNGLNMITSIGGSLYVGTYDWPLGNVGLTNLTGLNNLASIGGDLEIHLNADLEDLTGLESLINIDSSLFIYENPELTSLDALINLTFVGKNIKIISNDSLIDITGIGNIEVSTIENLTISGNPLLISCQAQSICDYLSNPGGSVNITGNSNGCENPPDIAANCGFTMTCLPYGNYYFSNQSEIDSFQSDYPNCSVLNGFVSIEGTNIKNLAGFNMIDTINGSLGFEFNDSLTTLCGLENLKYIAGSLVFFVNDMLLTLQGLDSLSYIGSFFWIKHNISLLNISALGNLNSVGGDVEIWECYEMTSLEGLNTLTNIGGSLVISFQNRFKNLNGLGALSSIGGELGVYNNDSLISVQGLNNLTSVGQDLSFMNNRSITDLTYLSNLDSIGGRLYISRNNSLKNLSGLDNINPESIADLYIIYNPMLSKCEVQSICDYLATPNGFIVIHDNDTGCDSWQQVDSACVYLSNAEINLQPEFSIYPNPSSSAITIETPITPEKNTLLTIYNISGQQLTERRISEVKTVIDVSVLSQGVYFLTVKDNKTVQVSKIVKQ